MHYAPEHSPCQSEATPRPWTSGQTRLRGPTRLPLLSCLLCRKPFEALSYLDNHIRTNHWNARSVGNISVASRTLDITLIAHFVMSILRTSPHWKPICLNNKMSHQSTLAHCVKEYFQIMWSLTITLGRVMAFSVLSCVLLATIYSKTWPKS